MQLSGFYLTEKAALFIHLNSLLIGSRKHFVHSPADLADKFLPCHFLRLHVEYKRPYRYT